MLIIVTKIQQDYQRYTVSRYLLWEVYKTKAEDNQESECQSKSEREQQIILLNL